MKERYWPLDGLHVLIDGVDIPLLLNSVDIFAESILVLLSFVTVMIINRLSLKHLLTIKRTGRLVGH